MPAPTRTPRHAWVDAGLRALAQGGPDAVRIEPLAKSLGVTRGGFYWHFADRADLLAALLEAWEHALVDDVVARVEEAGGSARSRLERLVALAGSKDEGGLLLQIDLAVRDWARRDPSVAERLRRADNRRIAYLRELFEPLAGDGADVEARCLLVITLWIGNHFVAAEHEGRSRAQVVELALERLLA
jgi:AcrR family transcriptional regulator